MEKKITLRNGTGESIDSHDAAVLAEWAGQQKQMAADSNWKRPFALIREGADLLLRQRHLAEETRKGE